MQFNELSVKSQIKTKQKRTIAQNGSELPEEDFHQINIFLLFYLLVNNTHL